MVCGNKRASKLLLIVGLTLSRLAASADDPNMESEIDFLLDTVVSSDCVFIRNGSEHAAQAARDHLQMKRKRGKRYYSTAEEFIEKIASKSSWSGNEYLIQCGDAPQQKAQVWFMSILDRLRASNR